MDLFQKTKGLLGDLIAFPTVSSDSNLSLISWAAGELQNYGADVQVYQDSTGEKANLFATFGPTVDGGIVLSGHSDVVPVDGQVWTSDPFSMTERDGRLHGRGACDMKGFIACVLALTSKISTWRLSRPLHIAITYDEEIGCYGARALVETLRAHELRPALGIVGEPTSMRIVSGHKGCYEYTTEFKGLEGHGSAPDKGFNAAVAATEYVAHLMKLAEILRDRAPQDSPFSPPWTTVNVGRIQAGNARNIIAGHAEVEWEMRPVTPNDASYVWEEIDGFADVLSRRMREAFSGARVTRHVIGEVAALTPSINSEAVELAAALTGENGTELAAFGTEAGLFQEIGIDCVVCGPGSIEQAHKPDEYIENSQILACLDMLGRLEGRLQ